MKKAVPYPRQKVRIQFVTNGGRRCTVAQFLKGILPALWDESDRAQVLATADHFTRLFNENRVFIYPHPLNLNATRLLDLNLGGYQHFPWELPEADLPSWCEVCRDWDFGKHPTPVKPLLTQGSAVIFVCPHCQHIVLDDPQAGKAGLTISLTKKELKARYGVEVPETPGQ